MEDSDLPVRVGDVLGERYWLLSELVPGTLWWADDFERSEPVAIHIMGRVALGDEARIAAAISRASQLEHPNLLPILDWGIDTVVWIATQLPTGGSLRDMIDAGHLLSPSQALVMGLELARVLEHLHGNGVLHGSIRPSALFFDSAQRLQVAALAVDPVTDASPGGEAGGVDDVRYWSPEEARGLSPDGRSDVYAAALTLCEAMNGRAPGLADSVAGLRLERGEASIEPAPEFGGIADAVAEAGAAARAERIDASALAGRLLESAQTMSRPEALRLVPLPAPDLEADALLDDPDQLAEAQLEVQRYTAAAAAAQRLEERTSELPLVEPSSLPEVAVPGLVDDDTGETLDLGRLRSDEAAALDVPSAATTGPAAADIAAYDQDDDFDAPWWPLAVLGSLIAVGAALFAMFFVFNDGDSSATVPDLVGLSSSDAVALVEEAGWRVDRRETRAEGSAVDEVVAQEPEAGSELTNSDVVAITVSLGNPLVEIPGDLVGLTVEQAQLKLNAVGLSVGALAQENNESLSEGLVIGVDEPVRQKPEGESIRLRISLGPQVRVVPAELVGLPLPAATELLAGLRLGIAEEQSYHPTAAVGVVIAVDPPPGTEVAADSRIVVTTSAGPEPVEIPDVTGLTLQQARIQLEGLGLAFIDSEGTPGNPAIGTIPPAGDVVDVGTEIIVVLGDGEEEGEGEGDGEEADGDGG